MHNILRYHPGRITSHSHWTLSLLIPGTVVSSTLAYKSSVCLMLDCFLWCHFSHSTRAADGAWRACSSFINSMHRVHLCVSLARPYCRSGNVIHEFTYKKKRSNAQSVLNISLCYSRRQRSCDQWSRAFSFHAPTVRLRDLKKKLH